MQSEKLDLLAKALAKVQATLKAVPRENVNPFYKSKYADLATIISHVSPVLSANGLAVVQAVDSSDNGLPTLVTSLLHESGQWISGRYPITPIKSDPQGVGSAITYARRYAYSAIVGVATEDDDDGNAASHAPARAPQRSQPPVESIQRGKLTPEDKAANAAGFDREPALTKVYDLPPLVNKGNASPPAGTRRYTFAEMKAAKDEAWANKRGREFDVVLAGGKSKNTYYMSVAAMKPTELEHALETIDEAIAYLESNGKETKYAVAERKLVNERIAAAGHIDGDGYATSMEEQADAQA